MVTFSHRVSDTEYLTNQNYSLLYLKIPTYRFYFPFSVSTRPFVLEVRYGKIYSSNTDADFWQKINNLLKIKFGEMFHFHQMSFLAPLVNI